MNQESVAHHKEIYFGLFPDLKGRELDELSSNILVVHPFNGLPKTYRPLHQNLNAESEVFTAVMLDVESTGLNTADCEIIDLAMTKFTCNKAGQVLDVLESFQCLNQPSEPLTDEVKRVTGYTDEQLDGHSINWGDVETFMKGVDLCIAYNASFDRPVIERYHEVFKSINWACAMKDVPWFDRFGAQGRLEFLAFKVCGMYFEAHKALSDVDFTIHLLTATDSSGTSAMKHMLDNALTPSYVVQAIGAPFDLKDKLRERGYRWNPNYPKCWEMEVSSEDKDEEIEVLKDRFCCFSPGVLKTDAAIRYSGRKGEKVL